MLHLYPGDVRHLTKEDYIVFSQQMKPYIRPRVGGVKELSMFTDGFGRYLADAGEQELALTAFSGEHTVDEAGGFFMGGEKAGDSVPFPLF